MRIRGRTAEVHVQFQGMLSPLAGLEDPLAIGRLAQFHVWIGRS